MLRITAGNKVIALALAILMFATPFTSLLAQQATMSDYVQGKIDGERDAKGNPLWILAGAGCGIFGAGAAYLIKPSPPAHALIGKSTEYVLGYTEGYKNKARSENTKWACSGWLLSFAVLLLVSTLGETSGE